MVDIRLAVAELLLLDLTANSVTCTPVMLSEAGVVLWRLCVCVYLCVCQPVYLKTGENTYVICCEYVL